MTKDEKIALSEKLAELYGVDAIREYSMEFENGYCSYEIHLVDDTKRIFELAVEHGLHIQIKNHYVLAYTPSTSTADEEYLYHPTKLEATLVAIAKALIKLKEQQ